MISLTAVGMLNAMGNTLDEIATSLVAGKAPGMVPDKDNWLQQGECWVGRVTAELPAVPERIPQHNSRNNRLLLAALAQIQPQVDEAIARYGRDRVAVVLGTSTSGLDEADRQVSGGNDTYHYGQQELGDPSRFMSE